MVICPHCNKNHFQKDMYKAARNVENYGSKHFTFKCRKCKKKYTIYLERKIEVGKPYITSNSTDLSF